MAYDEPVEFDCLGWDREIKVQNRQLPHWYQEGTAVFVTFRTIDSIPAEVLLRIHSELSEWLTAHGISPSLIEETSDDGPSPLHQIRQQVPDSELSSFRRLVRTLHDRALDECHGECLLRTPDVLDVMQDVMLYANDQKYDLDSFIVMPNHIHALLQFRDSFNQKAIRSSWMRYSTRLINQLLGRTGALWQPEFFDCLIRTEDQFHKVHDYIQNNPHSAGLAEGEFRYWCGE